MFWLPTKSGVFIPLLYIYINLICISLINNPHTYISTWLQGKSSQHVVDIFLVKSQSPPDTPLS